MVLVAGGLITAGFIALAACSNQGEGERCEIANGSDDCKTDEGLICYSATDLGSTSDRCCPSDRSKATHPACKTPISGVGSDAQAPTDSGPTDEGGSTTDASDGGEVDSGITDASDSG